MTNENPLLPLVRAALHKVEDPEIRRPITELGMVDELTANDEGQIFIKVLLTVPGCPMRTEISNRVTEAVEAVEGVRGVHVELGVMNDEQRSAMRQVLRGGQPERKIPFAEPGNLTKVIAVASGKGGVGKSSVTVNLAVALAKAGRSVAILDADIYGHSIPDLLGLGDARPTVVDDMILPVPAAEGLKVISVGMLKPSRDQVVAWRGPILDRALTQLLADVFWGDLDFLLLDLPPGTGDVAMSLGQKIPNSEVLVVTTRLGYEVPLLSQVPFDEELLAGGDRGDPIVLAAPDHPASQALLQLGQDLAARGRDLLGRILPVSPV